LPLDQQLLPVLTKDATKRARGLQAQRAVSGQAIGKQGIETAEMQQRYRGSRIEQPTSFIGRHIAFSANSPMPEVDARVGAGRYMTKQRRSKVQPALVSKEALRLPVKAIFMASRIPPFQKRACRARGR
jgi:hypothetical protein